ncbi:MAG: hypothetical protein V4541_05260 [Bacteroidota bacterium]
MKSALNVFLILLVVLGTSCKKDFKETQEKAILLTKPAGWLTLKTELKVDANNWVDITGTPLPTDADNLLIFDPWFSWAVSEGLTKVPGNAQIIANGTWNFIDNGTKIQITDGNLMEITELTETKLTVLVTADGLTKRYTYGHP